MPSRRAVSSSPKRTTPPGGSDACALAASSPCSRWSWPLSAWPHAAATTTNVGLAALAFYAGAGGLGQQILTDITFKSNILTAGVLCILLAFVLDLALVLAQRLLLPWQRVKGANP